MMILELCLARLFHEYSNFFINLQDLDVDPPPYVIPICLPWKKTDPGTDLGQGAELVVTGWGKVTNNDSITEKNVDEFDAPTRTLQKLVIPLVENDQCPNFPALKNFDPNIQLCSGAEKGEDKIFY